MYSKVINEQTKQVQRFLGTDAEWAIDQGFLEQDIEQAYNGDWCLQGYAPVKPEPTKEEIRAERNRLYEAEADPIRYDMDEALARGLSDEADALRVAWLAKKDEIRANNPYPVDN